MQGRIGLIWREMLECKHIEMTNGRDLSWSGAGFGLLCHTWPSNPLCVRPFPAGAQAVFREMISDFL